MIQRFALNQILEEDVKTRIWSEKGRAQGEFSRSVGF
jgi:hypothetical protein